MADAGPLLALGVVPDCIWGSDDDTTVYAQVFGQGRSVIFRFRRDPNVPRRSLLNRVVRCFNDITTPNEKFGFRDQDAMQSAVWATIAAIWLSCIADSNVSTPGAVVDVLAAGGRRPHPAWKVSREPLFDRYLDLLRDVQPSELVARDHSADIVDIAQVEFLESLGDRGCCKRVKLQIAGGFPVPFVFRGIDFQTYLQLHGRGGDRLARAVVETWRRSSRLIADMPPHPNIQPPPKILVAVCDRWPGSGGEPVVVGHLSSFVSRGDLAAVVASANASRRSIPLGQKARWCLQMSRAVAHAHDMHTYHMDIQPANLLVGVLRDLTLIDWEQSGAAAITLAPEADGTWDVREVPGGDGGTELVHTKYEGPERRNMPEGGGKETFNAWNVFPQWQAACPKASELAEVFALGRTMWMVLAQIIDDFAAVDHPNDVQVRWGDDYDIPPRWIDMVTKCMDRDPNERPLLADLVQFWEAQDAAYNTDS